MSDTYTPPADNPWHDTTVVIHRCDVADWLAKERDNETGDILTFGSRTTWIALHQEGPVDEFHLFRRIGPRAAPTNGGGLVSLTAVAAAEL